MNQLISAFRAKPVLKQLFGNDQIKLFFHQRIDDRPFQHERGKSDCQIDVAVREVLLEFAGASLNDRYSDQRIKANELRKNKRQQRLSPGMGDPDAKLPPDISGDIGHDFSGLVLNIEHPDRCIPIAFTGIGQRKMLAPVEKLTAELGFHPGDRTG